MRGSDDSAVRDVPTAHELRTVLRRHVVDAWFPRAIDTEHGGFLCDFDRRWRPRGRQVKLLEFQARTTRFAAAASRVFPEDASLRSVALHGLRCLSEVMWDAKDGGWFHRLDRKGRPLEAGTKHTHGAAYAIEACALVHEATGDPGALDLARRGFDWIDAVAHDARDGGWFGLVDRSGTPILDAAHCPWPAAYDSIGTYFGMKDLNVHSDLLESLVHLRRVLDAPRVEERLAEIVDVVFRRLHDPATGGLHYFVSRDWVPLPRSHRAGNEVQSVARAWLVRDRLGDRALPIARGIVTHALAHGLDPATGGIFAAGIDAPPEVLSDMGPLGARAKPTWVQFEALKAFLAMRLLEPHDPRWLAHFASQWRHLLRWHVDAAHGGTYEGGLDTAPRWRRRAVLAPRAITRKASPWKDGSHDASTLIFCLEHVEAARAAAGAPPPLAVR